MSAKAASGMIVWFEGICESVWDGGAVVGGI